MLCAEAGRDCCCLSGEGVVAGVKQDGEQAGVFEWMPWLHRVGADSPSSELRLEALFSPAERLCC
jgi:hypothetical protein